MPASLRSFFNEDLCRRYDSSSYRGSLRRPSGDDAAREAAVTVFECNILDGQAEASSDILNLRCCGSHPHLVYGCRDRHIAIDRERDPRCAVWKAMIGLGRSGAAHADQPFTIA